MKILIFTLLPMSIAIAFQNGTYKYESRQEHEDLVRSDVCKVTMYEDKEDKQKVLAVVQEQVDSDSELATEALKKQLLKTENLPKNGENIAFNVDCKRY